jgi:hypothetical protein
MSYKINQTDGTLLVDLVDGRIDEDTTDIVLVGRNYTGYGEYLNENLIRMLENFANSSAPSHPLRGQIWYDTSDGRLKVYNGTVFRSTDTTLVSPTQPTMLAGDLWIDSTNKQFYFNDGSDTILAGPIYNSVQGESGFRVESVLDRYGNLKTILKLLVGAAVVAIISRESFEPAVAISGFGSAIEVGINISSFYPEFYFQGVANSTSTLVDSSLNSYTPDSFFKISSNNIGTGTLSVKNDNGIFVGFNNDFTIKVEGSTVVNRNLLTGSDYKIQVRQGASYVDAITIDNSETKIGIWQSSPQYTLDVNGDLRVGGDLIVEGDTTYLDISTLRVEDKHIEIAFTSDSTLLTDAQLDGAGIIVKATGNDKSLTWNYTYNTWDSSTSVNIPTGSSYKIGHADILSATTLSSTVTSATGITQIGTLTNLDVDYINLNSASLTTTTYGLTINSADNITVSNSRKIIGVGTPDVSDDPDTVATKEYVDEFTKNNDIYLSLDITGLTNTTIASVLEDLVPAATKLTGVYAYVHTVYYSGSVTTDPSTQVVKSFVTVDKNGTENQSVLQDVSFNSGSNSVTLSVTRGRKRFIVNGSYQWVFESDLASSV